MKKSQLSFWIVITFISGVILIIGIVIYQKYVVLAFKPNTANQDLQKNDLKINAVSAISVHIDNNGKEKIIYEKNIDKEMLIASITKLMTAAIVLENYNLSKKARIDRKAVLQGGLLNVGDSFSVDTLLHIILIASDNTAAYTFSEMMEKGRFVYLMNLKAKELGLLHTHYSNSVGFGLKNHSTARDLVKLTYHLLKEHPVIFKISATPQYDIYDLGGAFHYKVANANRLLTEPAEWRDRIVGGKLGENEAAGGSLVIVLKSPDDNGYIINVILDSKRRFTEMKKLIDWSDKNF